MVWNGSRLGRCQVLASWFGWRQCCQCLGEPVERDTLLLETEAVCEVTAFKFLEKRLFGIVQAGERAVEGRLLCYPERAMSEQGGAVH